MDFARPDKRVASKTILNVDVLTPPAGVDFADVWDTATPAQMIGSTVVVRVASIPA